jgi:uncharacterized hydrophobic protein (TIGR00271 family)
MTTQSSSQKPRFTIRFSRTLSLVRAVAMSSSITIGMGVLVLVGLFMQQAGTQTPQAYLLAMVLWLPAVLTYAERATVTPGAGGIFGLIRTGGSTWRTYAGGWLLLGGSLALIALLGWGASLYLNISLERLFGVSIDLRWLAPAMIVGVALNDVIGTQGSWRLRTMIVYGCIAFLAVIALRSWFIAEVPQPPMPEASESDNLLRVLALMSAGMWGLHFALDSRDDMREPERNILPALLVPVLLAGSLGALLVATELRSLGWQGDPLTPLATLAIYTSFRGEALFEVIYVSLGLFVSLAALDRSMVTLLRLMGAMVRDGFLPERILKITPGLGTPLFALRLLAIGSALVAVLAPKMLLVGFVALSLLWATALFNTFAVSKAGAPLPPERPLKLPLHPLLPATATIISIALSFALPPLVLLVGAGWLVFGALFYAGYARQGGIQVRRRDSMVGDVMPAQRKLGYTVLVGIANPETAPDLIRAGAALSRSRQGRMLVLRVISFPDQVPQHLQRQAAQEQLQDLNQIVQQASIDHGPVEMLVRLARNPIDGILATSQEERADLIVLGWEGESYQSHFDLGPLIDPVVRAAACNVVVVRGHLPERPKSILVPTAGSPNTLAAMKLAQDMVDSEQGRVVALNLVQEVFSPTTMDEAEGRLRTMVLGLGGMPPVEPLVLATDDVKTGILSEAQNFDVLMLGASRGGALDQTIFGGLPVEVARETPRPALLVKRYEGARRFWARRAWETISAPFPKLTQSERDDIYHQMRRAANPSIDFFILIALSAMIATLGLLLSSPAVIIGAMLVAPLMSPILAIAMSMVQGDLRLLRLSANATALGIILAISVSIMVTLVVTTQINTSEILSRTRPNLLDLLVALASGAAGGYAMGRKEVAAALPGVAISAALVPPLGVIGYGTATGQLYIAGGSLLLFTTNLVAIIFAAAVIFLLLGFRPTQARMRQVVQIKFLLSLLALLLISIPLAVFSVDGIGQVARQNQVENVLNEEVESQEARITDIVVERQGDGFVVHATIYALDDLSDTDMESLQERLSNAMNAPVTLRATVLRAMLLPERGETLLPEPEPTP